MKTGIELIAIERDEHVTKHGINTGLDVLHNKDRELTIAASELLQMHPGNMGFPKDWDGAIVHKMASKPYKQRLIIAGALIAAEIDRLQAIEKREKKRKDVHPGDTF
mgnify:CR=1 FL=1